MILRNILLPCHLLYKTVNRPRNIFQNMNCIKSHWTLWKENHCRLIKGKNSEFKEVSSNELKIIDAQTRYIRLVSWQDFMKNFSDWKRRVQISSFFSFDYFEQWKCIENQKNVDTVTSKTMFLPVYTPDYSTYTPLSGGSTHGFVIFMLDLLLGS